MPQKIIIDTDPGVDDALAIFLALRSPELEVLGLTTVFGNVEVDLATTNALRLLEIAGRSDIPVAKGASSPLLQAFEGPVPHIHGEDGQGNVFLPEPASKPVDQSAAVFIVEQIMRHPGEVTLVPIGPFTNIALALRLEPRIAQHARVVLMGGNALEPGNATPAAEANIYNDPEAADIVMGAGWETVMVGLDVTHQTILSDAHIAEIGQMNSGPAQHIAKIVPLYRNFVHSRIGLGGIHIHDSAAVAYAINPEWFQTQDWRVRVDTTHGPGRGKTWPAMGRSDRDESARLSPWRGRPNVKVCTGVDAEKIVEISLERMR